MPGRFRGNGATLEVQQFAQAGEGALLLWGECVPEKPESLEAKRIGAVCSGSAAILKRINRLFHPPGRPRAFVPGLQWLSLLLAGYGSPPG